MIRRAGLQRAAGTKAEISSSGSMVYLIGRMKRDNPAIAKALARASSARPERRQSPPASSETTNTSELRVVA